MAKDTAPILPPLTQTPPRILADLPHDTADVRVGTPPVRAGGWGAMVSTTRVSLAHMGAGRAVGALLRVNQKHGFDCPGCAWPEPGHRSIVEFCENGAKAVAEEATTARADADFFSRHSVAELAAQSDHWLGQQGRLTTPLVLRRGDTHYRPIAWPEALTLVAEHLRALPTPDAALFYTSGRTSNEAAFLWQLFARAFGTNNLPDCSNMCHESSGFALTNTLGVGKGTVQLEDFDLADVILVIGQNPGTNHPRMLSALQSAVRRGAQVISINPLKEAGLHAFIHPQEPWEVPGEGTPLASQFVQVQVGGDVALFQALGKSLLELGVVDHAFMRAFTAGFDAYAAHLRALSWASLVAGAGVSRAEIARLAETLAGAQSVIACWAMGLTQHPAAVANIEEVVNLLLLGGHIGRPGAGVCPVRGHSNVQGDRTMGIWEKMPDDWLDRLGRRFAFSPPRHHGHDTVDAIRAMQRGDARVFLAMGGNFLSATPDTAATADALAQCDLTAHISTKLNRAHLVTGKTALILPCLGRTERDRQPSGLQFVTTENSMGVVQPSRGHLPPVSPDAWSEPRIVAELGHALMPNMGIDWRAMADDYTRIREAIADVVPGLAGFAQRITQDAQIVLHNAARHRDFRTSTGKANFTVHALPDLTLPDGLLRLMTLRSHDQYNTTIYGLDDRYRGIYGGRRVVLLHPADLLARGLADGDRIDVTSVWQGEERHAPNFRAVAYDVPRGNCVAYFPEANVLVPLNHVAAGSQTPASKAVPVRISRAHTA